MKNLPERKKIRLKEYDYSQNGAYFITICTQNKECILSSIPTIEAEDIRPILSEYGNIVDTAIKEIEKHYNDITVDNYVIMPNHIHLILVISVPDSGRIISAPTVMRVIGQMKRIVSKQIGFSIWQKSFIEHIIRDEDDYIRRYKYIENNPYRWLEKETDE